MNTSSFEQARALIDAANAADPNLEQAGGHTWPKEALYAHRMSDMLQRFCPEADEVQQLSARGQHIERWISSRDDFPEGRQGYLMWRTKLYAFHAQRVAEILAAAGYDEAAQQRAREAVGKRGLKINRDAQLIEDVAGLVFVEHYLAAFAEKHPEYSEEKWSGILGKTWKKMSAEARAFALAGRINIPPDFVAAFQRLGTPDA